MRSLSTTPISASSSRRSASPSIHENTSAKPDSAACRLVPGSAGCNRYFGRFLTPGGDSLVLGQAGSTMMACPEPAMTQEYRYLQALGGVGRYRMTGSELVLLGGAGQLLRFVLGPAGE